MDTNRPTKARYAAAMLPIATRIVEAVRDESHETLVHLIRRAHALPERPDDVDPHIALVAILAAMVDPGRTVDDLLGWTRDLGPVKIHALTDGEDYETRMAIEGALPAAGLPKPKRLDVVRALTERGLTADQISIRTGLALRTIDRYRHDAGLTQPRGGTRDGEAA